ncbi:MAG: hypothetical protein M3N45_07655 [Actinomycetota bacterium]|nr:hypothetical protein [Actinomycetota bacterium]
MAFDFAERQRFIEILCEEWEKGPGTIESKTIYDKLRSEDIIPEPGNMDAFLTLLSDQNLIRTAKFHDREGIAEHGAMTITDVDADAICP